MSTDFGCILIVLFFSLWYKAARCLFPSRFEFAKRRTTAQRHPYYSPKLQTSALNVPCCFLYELSRFAYKKAIRAIAESFRHRSLFMPSLRCGRNIAVGVHGYIPTCLYSLCRFALYCFCKNLDHLQVSVLILVQKDRF